MELEERINDSKCIPAILSCFTLSIIYVASLYVWNSPYNREDPTVMKKRFISVIFVNLISPASLYFGLSKQVFEKSTVLELLGLRWTGLIQAAVLPVLLTMILFLGPLTMQRLSNGPQSNTGLTYWVDNICQLKTWRNLIIAPLSEEWTFRACMLPLLVQCFAPCIAIFLCSMFFGIVHFHHMFERIKLGMRLQHAIFISCFQFIYTTLFGAYAAFLFMRTGHFVAPFLVHSFCNYMGFPDFNEVIAYTDPLKKILITFLFIIGFVSWVLLLIPTTEPILFYNNLYWCPRFS